MPENRKKPLLFEKYPDLEADIPWKKLAPLRTPVKKLTILEKKLGIKRSRIIEKMYGGDALLLWRMFRASGDDYYLRLLVEYNEEDVFNLKKIADHVCKRLMEKSIAENKKEVGNKKEKAECTI